MWQSLANNMKRVRPAAALQGVGLGAVILVVSAMCAPQAVPAASPVATASVAATTAPVETAVPVAVPPQQLVVYYPRDGLPVRATALGNVALRNSVEDRISARLSALWGAQPSTPPPPGASNPFAKSGRVGSQGQLGISVRIDGELATVTFDLLGGWGITTADEARGLYQQLVYTITEEPGVRSALIKEKGRADALIGPISVTQPATREDVAGYSFSGTKTRTIIGDGTQVPEDVTNVGVAIDTEILTGTPAFMPGMPALGRVGVELRASGGVTGGRLDPRFAATIERCDPPTCDGGKWTLTVTLPDAKWPASRPAYAETFDRSPIRSVRAAEFQGGTVAVAIRLDDARPWRVATESTGAGTARLYVDIGGSPADVNENIAVYLPVPGQGAGDRATGCTCTVRGAARVFEANVAWRVRDGNGREVARGNTTASRGTGPVWGVFTTTVTIPPAVAGQVTIEVYDITARDGSEQDVIRIPVTLH
jgi:hypothetical protein